GLEGLPRRRRRGVRRPRPGAGQPRLRHRPAAAGPGPAHRRLGAGTLRGGPGTGATPGRRGLGKLMSSARRPLPVPLRAALLMLGSTALFGLMVVAIRLASASLHTFEVAFFRNFFGLLAALPLLLLRHGPGLLRTQHFPRYLFRCLVGICSMLAGFWAIGHLPLA